jgi:hypothetical protein
VSAAVWLLYLVAAAWLSNGVIQLTLSGAMTEALRRSTDGSTLGPDGATTLGVVATILAVGLSVLWAAGFIVLGALDARGRNVARIVTWVVAGLAVCCSGQGLASGGAADFGAASGGGSGVDSAEFQRAMEELVPSWFAPASNLLAVVRIVGLLAVIVLLMLPAASRFFRREPPPWEPPRAGVPPMNLPPQ